MEQGNLARPDSNLDRLLISTDLEEPWFKSVIRSIREAKKASKLPPLEITSKPVDDGEFGDISKVEIPWYKSLVSNIHDLVRPPKLPPLEVTSKPVEVGSIWGAYGGGEKKSGAVSILIHVGVVALLFLVFQSKAVQKKVRDLGTIIYVPPYKLPPAAQKAGGGGGGGQKMPEPVNKGEAPKFERKQFLPPVQAIPQPKLPTPPTITAQAPQIQADLYGDPLSKMLNNSGGQGANGFGNGSGGGIGSGNGNGYGPGSGGGMGGGVYQIGGEVSQPVPIFRPEPEYSEEARKAKFQGTVLLSVVIDANGNTREIHVIRPLGLGLDEKAIEAVSKWRFRPATKGGHPVAVQAQIEVNFRLL
ncbi:MAG TPA: energy transducer TonB [Bryobacteraceae bacterium]|nr:energy transducer TonB [Bryobacteraceae bacterium]